MSALQGTARTVVAAQIQADNPDYVVCSYPAEPSQVTNKAPYVDVYTTNIRPENGERDLRHEVTIEVYVAQRGTAEAEAQVEDARDEVLLSLQRLLPFQWEGAERVVFQEAYTGYKITGWMPSTNEYRQIIQAEGSD